MARAARVRSGARSVDATCAHAAREQAPRAAVAAVGGSAVRRQQRQSRWAAAVWSHATAFHWRSPGRGTGAAEACNFVESAHSNISSSNAHPLRLPASGAARARDGTARLVPARRRMAPGRRSHERLGEPAAPGRPAGSAVAVPLDACRDCRGADSVGGSAWRERRAAVEPLRLARRGRAHRAKQPPGRETLILLPLLAVSP